MKRNSHILFALSGSRNSEFWILTFIVLLSSVFATPLSAGYVPYVSGQSTAALIEEGEFAGLYRYDIVVAWNIRKGLTQLNLLLEDIGQNPDYEIAFPNPAATTSISRRHWSNRWASAWTASLQSNVSGLFSESENDSYIKYVSSLKPHFLSIGRAGFGTFSFYSDIAPEYGTFEDVLIAEGNWNQKIFGDLTGAYPNCSCSGGKTPEPATIALLGLGSYFIILRKKRQ